MHLPVGIRPTTAIPTYVMDDGGKNEIRGCSSRGGLVNLLEIDPDLLSKLSHDFLSSFDFNLKSIMPFIFINTCLPYQHLCFIDTPGYNPADRQQGYTKEDRETAQAFMENAEAVLWLIGVDANGTISSSDLAFLRQVVNVNEDKPIYFILNKADLKPQDEIEAILDTIQEMLDDNDIPYAGIAAYSSRNKEEIWFIEQSLEDFLTEMDTVSDKRQDIHEKLDAIENKYLQSIEYDKQGNQWVMRQLNSIKLDLMEMGVLDEETSGHNQKLTFSERVDVIRQQLSKQRFDQYTQEIKEIVEKFRWAVDQVFAEDVIN